MHRKWWTLIVVSVATFMLLLDITVVNTALPAIHEDLGASFTELQWVIDAYTLSLAALVLTAGVLADRLGRKRVFAAGLGIFTVASALAGFAPDPTFLNVARAIQGVGGAIMFAVSLALVAQEFKPGRERGVAMGVYGATIGVAVAFGPLVGGALVEGIGWESIFFLNVPIGLAALVVTSRHVQESRDPNASRIDWAGLVTFSTALFLLVLGLIRGNEEGWGSTLIVSMLVGAAVLLAVFFVVEARGKEPMLELALFRKPAFDGASIAAFVLSASMFAMFLYLTFYVQNQLGYSALESGLRFLPVTILSFIVAPISGKLAERFGVRWFVGGGLSLVGIGLLLMSGRDAGDDWTALLPGFLLCGIGIGMTNPALATAAVGIVEPARAGMASGVNSTFRQIGIATGIAAWGALFTHVVNSKAGEFARAVGGSIPRGQEGSFADFISFGLYRRIGEQAVQPGREAFLDGLNHILVVAGVVALIGALLCLVLIRPRDFVAHGAEQGAPPDPSARTEPGGRGEPQPAGA